MKDYTKYAFLLKLIEDALRPIADTIVKTYYQVFAEEETPKSKVNVRELIDMMWCLLFEPGLSKWYVELEEYDVKVGKDDVDKK